MFISHDKLHEVTINKLPYFILFLIFLRYITLQKGLTPSHKEHEDVIKNNE